MKSITSRLLGVALLAGLTSPLSAQVTNVPPGVIPAVTIRAVPVLNSTPTVPPDSLTRSNPASLWLNASRVPDRSIQPVMGGGRAEFGLQKAFFPVDVKDSPVALTAPDARILTFRVTFLALHDLASDQSLLIAEVTNRDGAILGADQVVYTNAFDTLRADIRYRYTQYSLEQDIVLHEHPVLPEEFSPENTRLEIWTEWFDSEPVAKSTQPIDLRDGSGLLTPSIMDDVGVDFGTAKIVTGHAFSSTAQNERTPVGKRWVQQGRDWLVETVDYLAVKSKLDLLPAARRTASINRPASKQEELIRSLAKRTKPPAQRDEGMLLAQATTSRQPEFVMDFVIVSSVPVPSGVVSWWPAGGNGEDAINTNDTTLVSGAGYASGKVGQGFNLDGTDDRITALDSASLDFGAGEDFSIEAWIKPETNSTFYGFSTIFSKRYSPNLYTTLGYELLLEYGRLGLRLDDPSNKYYFGTTNLTPNLRDGSFHHVAVTVDRDSSTGLKFYIDGVEIATFDPTVSPGDLSNTEPLRLGNHPTPGLNCFYKGVIDEPALYDRVLGASEIEAIYNAGAAGKHNPNCITAPTNIVGWWPGDGNNYDLARTNIASLINDANYAAAEVSHGFSLDGSDGHLRITDRTVFHFTSALTIEGWIRPTSLDSYASIVDKWDAVVGYNQKSYDLSLYPGGQCYLLVSPGGTDTGATYVLTTNAVSANAWTHVAGVYDGTKLKVYLNGILQAEGDYTSGIFAGTNDFAIGGVVGGAAVGTVLSPFPGLIDEPSIYSRALTATEIASLYAAGSAGKCKVDSDGDGLTDLQEEFLETNSHNADSDYDGRSDFEEWADGTDPNDAASCIGAQLGYWRFNTPQLIGEQGQEPTIRENTSTPSSWSATALSMDSSSLLRYREIEPAGHPNINCRQGTVRFWFKPHWSSTTLGGTGPQATARLVELGGYGEDAWWCLYVDPTGTTVAFAAKSNGTSITYFALPFQFAFDRWYQIALTYSATNIACYTNGLLAATCTGVPTLATGEWLHEAGNGIYTFPPPVIRAAGFRVGNDWYSGQQARGEFEELETFSYPLTAQEVAQDFPDFTGAAGDARTDSDYDGRSDLLEQLADGTVAEDPDDVVATRLGYWRFNTAGLVGEMGQRPLQIANVSQPVSWSSTALAITTDTASRVVYRDVETNGWANVNCRHGAVRFWFKPNWDSGSRIGPDLPPILYLGDGTSNGWTLYLSTDGRYLGFLSLSNNTPGGFMATELHAVSNQWQLITFNYSATNLALYTNGVLAVSSAWGVSAWPDASVRSNGVAFGNRTEGGSPLEAQLEEVETFNYCLSSEEISRGFESLKSVDCNLNGVADVLEEISLTNSAPFTVVPFPVTGVFEAEQFDLGGPDVGYHTLDAANATSDYRVSRLWITNCDDLGGGYCVDHLRAGEWLKYTVDVRVGQTYAVESRVAGLGTNGVFTIEFATNGITYAATTNHLTLADTNWANVTFKNLWLAAGTNVMTVRLLTNGLVNGVGSGAVAKLNYVSIYPSWNEGVANIAATNYVTGLVSNLCDWVTASNNAVAIQNAIDSLDLNQGGLVVIPEGRFYVAARKITDETQDADRNAVVFVSRNNVQIHGSGKTNTTLVAHNRAVTLFYAGRNINEVQFGVTNFALVDLSLEASPHWVYVPSATNQRVWEDGAFWPNPSGGYRNTGCLVVGAGNSAKWLDNILVTNCLFKNSPLDAIVLNGHVTHFLAVRSDFLFRADGTNGGYTGQITDPSRATTVYYPSDGTAGVGLYVRTAGPSYNINVVDCSFDGHVNATNVDLSGSACGLIFCQSWGGNWFAARNAITNYGLEAIQWNSGPAAAIQNRCFTGRESSSTCGFCPLTFGASGPTGLAADLGFSIVGNTVTGGRQGVYNIYAYPAMLTTIASVLVSGNELALESPYPISNDGPGAALSLWWADRVGLSGNTLIRGGKGYAVGKVCTNALVLKNEFSGARKMSIDDWSSGLSSAVIAKNKLSTGPSFHLRARMAEGVHQFLIQNDYLNTNGIPMNPFLEPLALPVHYQP